jgi:hypothetical protein
LRLTFGIEAGRTKKRMGKKKSKDSRTEADRYRSQDWESELEAVGGVGGNSVEVYGGGRKVSSLSG